MCTSCGEVGYPTKLNDLGHCQDCVSEQEKWEMIDNRDKEVRYCRRCQDPVHSKLDNYCESCKVNTEACIHCSENQKRVIDFACNTCKIKYMKKEKK